MRLRKTDLPKMLSSSKCLSQESVFLPLNHINTKTKFRVKKTKNTEKAVWPKIVLPSIHNCGKFGKLPISLLPTQPMGPKVLFLIGNTSL